MHVYLDGKLIQEVKVKNTYRGYRKYPSPYAEVKETGKYCVYYSFPDYVTGRTSGDGKLYRLIDKRTGLCICESDSYSHMIKVRNDFESRDWVLEDNNYVIREGSFVGKIHCKLRYTFVGDEDVLF